MSYETIPIEDYSAEALRELLQVGDVLFTEDDGDIIKIAQVEGEISFTCIKNNDTASIRSWAILAMALNDDMEMWYIKRPVEVKPDLKSILTSEVLSGVQKANDEHLNEVRQDELEKLVNELANYIQVCKEQKDEITRLSKTLDSVSKNLDSERQSFDAALESVNDLNHEVSQLKAENEELKNKVKALTEMNRVTFKTLEDEREATGHVGKMVLAQKYFHEWYNKLDAENETIKAENEQLKNEIIICKRRLRKMAGRSGSQA